MKYYHILQKMYVIISLLGDKLKSREKKIKQFILGYYSSHNKRKETLKRTCFRCSQCLIKILFQKGYINLNWYYLINYKLKLYIKSFVY